ncbi:MAG: hypothetical protein ACR2HS_02940, partial [Gammaproteobacteria bacterium]
DLNNDHFGIEKGIVYSGYKNTKGSLLKKSIDPLSLGTVNSNRQVIHFFNNQQLKTDPRLLN